MRRLSSSQSSAQSRSPEDALSCSYPKQHYVSSLPPALGGSSLLFSPPLFFFLLTPSSLLPFICCPLPLQECTHSGDQCFAVLPFMLYLLLAALCPAPHCRGALKAFLFVPLCYRKLCRAMPCASTGMRVGRGVVEKPWVLFWSLFLGGGSDFIGDVGMLEDTGAVPGVLKAKLRKKIFVWGRHSQVLRRSLWCWGPLRGE